METMLFCQIYHHRPLLKKNKARLAQNDAAHYSGSSRAMKAGPGTLNAAQSHRAGL
jgi:hypothetical protein